MEVQDGGVMGIGVTEVIDFCKR